MKFINTFIALILCITTITQSAQGAARRAFNAAFNTTRQAVSRHRIVTTVATAACATKLYTDAHPEVLTNIQARFIGTRLAFRAFNHELVPDKLKFAPSDNIVKRAPAAIERFLHNRQTSFDAPADVIACLWAGSIVRVPSREGSYEETIDEMINMAATLHRNNDANVVAQATALFLRAIFLEILLKSIDEDDLSLSRIEQVVAKRRYLDALIPKWSPHYKLITSLLLQLETALRSELILDEKTRFDHPIILDCSIICILCLPDWLDELVKNPNEKFLDKEKWYWDRYSEE